MISKESGKWVLRYKVIDKHKKKHPMSAEFPFKRGDKKGENEAYEAARGLEGKLRQSFKKFGQKYEF